MGKGVAHQRLRREQVANKAAVAIYQALDAILTHAHPLETIEADLLRALTEASNWAGQLQFFGMPTSKSTKAQTIGLKFGIPRKFSMSDAKSLHDERDLLVRKRNVIVLGDPGAGKTTTVKRLIRQTMYPGGRTETEKIRFPLVLLARDYPPATSVFQMIAKKLGLEGHLIYPSPPPGTPYIEPRQRTLSCRLGNSALDAAVVDIVNVFDPIIFLDGLDELDPADQAFVEEGISGLAKRLAGAHIVATCRSGSFQRHVEGFEVAEIQPLEAEQIKQVIGKWLTDPDGFFRALAELPSQDFLERPLLLAQVIVLFEKSGYLPRQPTRIYRRLAMVLLQEWDEQHKPKRRTDYAGFEREEKHDFLCALAYHLTWERKIPHFTHHDLIIAYHAIHERFGLPANQAIKVAREIQSHTGIIVEETDGGFAFSHRTFQEYLCADYIVRQPFADLRPEYRSFYPEVLAVAAALSSDPTRWLAFLLSDATGADAVAWRRLLQRLVMERPTFVRSKILGMTALMVCNRLKSEGGAELDAFMGVTEVKESAREVLGHYKDTGRFRLPAEIMEVRRQSSAPLAIGGMHAPETLILLARYHREYGG